MEPKLSEKIRVSKRWSWRESSGFGRLVIQKPIKKTLWSFKRTAPASPKPWSDQDQGLPEFYYQKMLTIYISFWKESLAYHRHILVKCFEVSASVCKKTVLFIQARYGPSHRSARFIAQLPCISMHLTACMVYLLLLDDTQKFVLPSPACFLTTCPFFLCSE